jgi:hypothetical protein
MTLVQRGSCLTECEAVLFAGGATALNGVIIGETIVTEGLLSACETAAMHADDFKGKGGGVEGVSGEERGQGGEGRLGTESK